MNVIEIRTEGREAPPPRNQRRIIVAIDVAPQGVEVEGRYCPHGESLIEVYEDRLDEVQSRVQTAHHLEVWRQAEQLCEVQRSIWRDEHAKDLAQLNSDEERKRYEFAYCNLHPAQFLVWVDKSLKSGLPPLRSMHVVSQGDHTQRITLEDFRCLTEEEQEAFCRPPPRTGVNDMERAAAMFAQAMRAGAGSTKRGRGQS